LNPRLIKLVSLFLSHRIDACLVVCAENIRYLAKFPAAESWLLVTFKKAYYFTDFRYGEEARQGLRGIAVRQYKRSLIQELFGLIKKKKIKRIGIELRHISAETYQRMKAQCPRGVKLIPLTGLVESLRVIKEPEEIKLIRDAVRINLNAFRYLKGVLKEGMAESDLLKRLEGYVRRQNVKFSFDPIIASGPHSSMPHAKTGDKRVSKHQPLLVDMGVDVQGYKSDLTRIFFLGKIPPHIREVYEKVKEAQARAIAAVRPGIQASIIDQQARKYLKKKGLAKYFGHSLGHGIGLEVHEAPIISSSSPWVLKTGMIFTVEPAVYLPKNFGIRIEDMILVTPQGCQILS